MKSMSFSILFLLCCSNVVPAIIESNDLDDYIQGVDKVDNLWYLKPAHDAVYDKTFVRSLNNIVTLEKKKVVFSDDEEDLLTKECNVEDKSCSENKVKSLTKFNTKLQAIKCVNSVIVESLFVTLDNILLSKLRPKDLNEVFLKYRIIMTRMLSVLYAGKSYVPRWNLTIHIRLLGSIDIFNNKWAFLSGNSNLKKDVENYKNKCRINGYVPSDKNDLNINALVESLYNNSELTELYRHAGIFSLGNLILNPLYSYDHHLLMSSKWNKIDWTKTRELLSDAKTGLIELYLNSKEPEQWTLIPLRRFAYHEAILKIIYVRLLHCTWLHLMTYQYNVNNMQQPGGAVMEVNLMRYWNLLLDPLHEAVWFAAIDDSFFWSMLHTLKSTVKRKISNERLTELVSISRDLLKEYLKLLKVEDVTNLLDNITPLDIDRKNLTLNYNIRDNTENLSNFITNLKEIFHAIHIDSIFFIKFLIQAKTDISFFTPNFVYPCFPSYQD